MPGFLDMHTHYDAELIAAPSLGESVRHGVTTVTVGSCSISAILSDAEDCSDLFTRVESVPARAGAAAPARAQDVVDPARVPPLPRRAPARRRTSPSFLGHSDVRARVLGLGRAVDSTRAAARGRAARDGALARGGARRGVPRPLDDDEPVGQARRGPLPLGAASVDVRDVGRVPAPQPRAPAPRAHPPVGAQPRQQGQRAPLHARERGLRRAQDARARRSSRWPTPSRRPGIHRVIGGGHALRQPRASGPTCAGRRSRCPSRSTPTAIDLVVFEEFGAGRRACTWSTRWSATR